MSSTEKYDFKNLALGLGLAALLGGCSVNTGSVSPTGPSSPATPSGASSGDGQGGRTPTPGSPSAPGPSAKPSVSLPPPKAVRKPDDLRLQAAQRLVAANPERSYMGLVPDILLAIPVLEVELNQDGSVKRVNVLRKPGQAPETVQLAIEAIHRAAPFGNVAAMPKPWKFTETFLFNDERRFKPRTLD
ncbi:hypothetical protein [Paucibacter sp. KCTC 42545]|uniref:hypothetical protein n=1 Tax=Paucibacter sp. KCTC 42545 TaxID=1768242 RepID=UPI000ACDE8B6|nr:hypothetical protein [Paucibacter sp. KCTC 42545]